MAVLTLYSGRGLRADYCLKIKVLKLSAGSVIAEVLLGRSLNGRRPIDTFYFLKQQEEKKRSTLLRLC
jgi:hypothetical protein